MDIKKVFVGAVSRCSVGEQGTWRYKKFFASQGCELTETVQEADIVLCTTCGIFQYKLDESLKLIESLRAQGKAGSRFVVAGCVPLNARDALRQAYQGMAIESVSDLFGLRRLIEADPSARKALAPQNFDVLPFSETAQAYMVRSSYGCMSRCSFCAIKNSIGNTRSRPVESIVRDIRQAVRDGHRTLILNSDDNGAYGFDLGIDLTVLLDRILELPEEFELHIHCLHPQWMLRFFKRLRRQLASPKIGVVGSQVQSGSDRLLRLMRRHYTAEDFKGMVKEIYAARPSIRVSSGVISGFPSETEEEFAKTLDLVGELQMDWVDAYAFDERPGTTVPKELERLPLEVLLERQQRMLRATKLAASARRAGRRATHYAASFAV